MMKLQIKDDITVAALQAEFNAIFPFLRLEVKPCLTRIEDASELLLKQCRRQHNDGEFELNEDERLIDFVGRLKNEFGLVVEVYRNCGKLWIATTLSNTWTLQRQNNEGFEINSYKSD